jgi:aminomuconate-semialdehyde/2-hydroxymuconate-6-semialdehyde dehydrogenase
MTSIPSTAAPAAKRPASPARPAASLQTLTNFINGRPEPPSGSGGGYLDDVDPSIGAVYARVPDSDERDIERAVAAAEAAFPAWSRTPGSERSRLMLRLADLLERDLERFALAECIDNGKPITLTRTVDLPRAIANLRFFASAIVHARSESYFTEASAVPGVPGAAISHVLRQPRGVAGCISPWNLPLYLLTWKFAPALAAGNTVVAKPSEVTPMTAFMLGGLVNEAGFPPGVINIVHGSGAKAGAALVAHPRVPAISFTGGTRTGAEIARVAAPMFKKLSLELGGKNPNVVFADCDFDETVKTSVRAGFTNQGQVCLCGSRILVEKPLYERFVGAFVERAKALRIGDPLEESTEQGAVVSKPHFEKILSCIERAKAEGGTILCGGGPRKLAGRCAAGYFIEPTVITGLNHSPACRTNQEEIFGPVVTIQPFADEAEAIELANATPYGLSATVFTRDLARAHRAAAAIEAGTVWVNSWLLRDLRVPFGGMKASGIGREGGEEALHFFTEAKNVCVRMER